MQAILPFLIVGQILLASFFLRSVDHKKVTLGSVLGVRVAQAPDTTEVPAAPASDNSAPPPAAPETSAPVPETGTPATEQPVTSETPTVEQPVGGETGAPNPSVAPVTESPTLTVDQNNLFKDILEVSPTESPTPAETQPLVLATPTVEVTVEATAVQTAAVLNPGDLLNSAEEVSKQSVDEAKKEEAVIAETKDPVEQSRILVDYATDKVKDINNFIRNDDFASTNFASQRFNDHLDRVVDNISNLPPEKARQVTKQLANFCTQADAVLRSAELSVPEEAEPDIEINRAKCLEFAK